MAHDSKARDKIDPGSGAGRAILSYAPSRFIEPILGFLSLPVLTRVLSVEDFGNFSIIFLTASLIRTIGFDWIANCALRFRRSLNDNLDSFCSNIVVGQLTSCLASFLLLSLLVRSPASDSLQVVETFFWWILADAFFSSLAYSGEMILRADQNPKAFTISRGLQGFSRHVLGVGALVAFEGNLQAYFVARITGTVLTALWSWRLSCSPRNLRLASFSLVTQKQFFIFGFPLALSIFANALRVMGNRYVVMWHEGPEATGLFSAAANIGSSPLLIFQQIVMLGLYPLAINSWENGKGISPIARDGLRYFFLLGIPSLAGLAMLSQPILRLIAGPGYAEAWPVLAIIALAMFIYGLSQYFSLSFMVEKRTWILAAIGISAGVFSILLAVALIPRLGYSAAAVSLVLSNVMLLGGLIIWSSGSWRESIPFSSLVNCLLAVVPMSAGIYFWGKIFPLTNPVSLVGVVLFAVVVFFLVVWRRGEIDEEWEWILKKIKLEPRHP